MAVGTETRERPGARPRDTQPDTREDIASLLLSGDESDDEGDSPDDGYSAEEDELGLSDGDSETDDEDGDDEGDDDGNATEDGAESGTAGEGPAAAEVGQYVDSWAARVREKPGAIMQVPANRRNAVLKAAFAGERNAATEAMRDPIRKTIEQISERMYQQGMADARAAFDGDTEFEEVRDLAENDLPAFGQLAHTPEGAAKVRRYLERLETERNPSAGAKPEAAIATASARLMEKIRGNPAVLAELQAKEKADPGRYAPTPDGLAALSEDAAEAFANVRVAGSKAKDPDQEAAERRRNGAAHRSRLPRTAGGEGRAGAGTADDTAWGASAADDLRAGLREEFKTRR